MLTLNFRTILNFQVQEIQEFQDNWDPWKCKSSRVPFSRCQLRISYCQCHTMKCHILRLRNSKLFTLSDAKFVQRFSSRQPAALKTRSLAADDAGMHRIRRARENILGSTVRLSRQKEIWRYKILLASIHISTVRASERWSIIANRKSTMRFPTSYRWSAYVTPNSPKGWLKKRICRFCE